MPTLLWLCVLAVFSSDLFSAEHTGGVLAKILDTFFPSLSAESFARIHFLVRKTAHFVSYGTLGAFAFFSWRATFPARPRWTLRWSALALLLVLTAAALDEFHQTFVASRTGAVRDVVLDCVGAFFFQLAIAIWLGWRHSRTTQ
jgi:VanZ family protein